MREFVGTNELKDARIRDADMSGIQIRGASFAVLESA